MAFEEKEIKKTFMLLLVAFIIQVTFVDATNFDCKGKAFYCLNSTHFMICVDLGDGISKTVGDFLIPCPPPTICTENNNFECEYYTTTTLESIISQSEETKSITKPTLNTFIEDSVSTTVIPFWYKSDDFVKSEKYFNTVSITTTENNLLDKANSISSSIKLTPEETTIAQPTDQSVEEFTADLTVPIDIQNGTETTSNMQDTKNEFLNANNLTIVFMSVTKEVPESLNTYESTIVNQSTNAEFMSSIITVTEVYDLHTSTYNSEHYFDTISTTTLSESTTTEKPIIFTNEEPLSNITQENYTSLDGHMEDTAEQSSTDKYILFDIFDVSTTKNRDEINTYGISNTIITTVEVDNSSNDLYTTTTNLESKLPIQNMEITTKNNLLSDVNLEVLETTQSPDTTMHTTLTTSYQLEETTQSFGFNDKVRIKINNQKKDEETYWDTLGTDSEGLQSDFSTQGSDIMQLDIYFKTTPLEANERGDSDLPTQFHFIKQNKISLFSTNQEDGTSKSSDLKDEITTDIIGNEVKNEINIMGIKPNFKIKNRDVFDTDEMFAKVSTIAATKDYYTFENRDSESTLENDVTSEKLLFSIESTTSSYVFDDDVFIDLSDVLNITAFNSDDVMGKNNEENFPLSFTTKIEENMTHNNISENTYNKSDMKVLNISYKPTVSPFGYEKATNTETENVNINKDLFENKVTLEEPDLITTRILSDTDSFHDLDVNIDKDNYKYIKNAKTSYTKYRGSSYVSSDSFLSTNFKSNKETKTTNANTMDFSNTEQDIELPRQVGLKNYEVKATEFAVLPTEINNDDSYVSVTEEIEINVETRENNLVLIKQKPTTISEHNLRSDIDEKYYFDDKLSFTDMNLNTELNVPTEEPVLYTLKDQSLKVPFPKNIFFYTTGINTLDEENIIKHQEFDAATTASLLKDSYMLTTPENTAILETTQNNFKDKMTSTNDEVTTVLSDILGTDVTESVYMTLPASTYIDNKITSDKLAYETLFKNNTVTDGYNNRERRVSETNFSPKYIMEDKRDALDVEYNSQNIKNVSKNLRNYPPNVAYTDSSTSLYTTVNNGLASMLKLSTAVYNKAEQFNELNTLKDELISSDPTISNFQDTTIVYKKEDTEAREINKIIQNIDYKTDISRVSLPKYIYATTRSEVKEVTKTTGEPKLFTKLANNIGDTTTRVYILPYQIKEYNSDLIQNKNIIDKGQPSSSDVNPTLTDINIVISPKSKDPQVKLLTLISNEKTINRDKIVSNSPPSLSNNLNKKKILHPNYDITQIERVSKQSTKIPSRIQVDDTSTSVAQNDKTSNIILPENEENNSKINANVSMIHSELHQNHSLLFNTSKVNKFNTTGRLNESIVNPGSITVHDMVLAKTLSDYNIKTQKQYEINATEPENSDKSKVFSYKKNETNPIINKNITRHVYATVPPVNMEAITFNCLNRRSGKYSDHNNCQRFYICIGRLFPIVGQCPINTVFSEFLKQCTHNLSHCIRNDQFQCITSGRFSDMWARDTYYICVKSNKKYIRFKLKCQKGYYLNRTSITCIEDNVSLYPSLSKDSYSIESSSSSVDSRSVQIPSKGIKNEFRCVRQGIFPDSNDCKKYYVCDKKSKSEFRRKKKKCDSDEVFHKIKKKCVDEESYECNT